MTELIGFIAALMKFHVVRLAGAGIEKYERLISKSTMGSSPIFMDIRTIE